MSYTFCLLKLDLLLSCLDFGLFDLDNLVWDQFLTEREKTHRFTQTTHCPSAFPELQTCVLHQQFIPHWIFPALLFLCTVTLTWQLWGCQPWAGLPPCLTLLCIPLPFPHGKTLPSASHTLQGNNSSVTALMFVFCSSVEQLQTMELCPGELCCSLLLCCIFCTNVLWGCRTRQKE